LRRTSIFHSIIQQQSTTIEFDSRETIVDDQKNTHDNDNHYWWDRISEPIHSMYNDSFANYVNNPIKQRPWWFWNTTSHEFSLLSQSVQPIHEVHDPHSNVKSFVK
jgi:hypothetical protein